MTAFPTSHRERPVVPVLIGAGLIAVWGGTQILAHTWHFAPGLGSPLLRGSTALTHWGLGVLVGSIVIGVGMIVVNRTVWRWSVGLVSLATCVALLSRAPVYSPFALVQWTIRYASHPAAIPTIRCAWGGAGLLFCLGLMIGFTVTSPRTRRRSSTSHGSAQWGTGEPLHHAEGLHVGILSHETLRYRGDGHLVTIAPTRSGKGVSVIIPNLLTYPGSVVVTDPKGENYAVTARRRRELGTTVHALDPFDVVGGTATCNPLDVIHPKSLDAVDDARMFADMLVVVEGKETGEQSFWNEEARALLAGLILYVVAHEPPQRRTLTQVRTLLTLPPTLWHELLTRMSESPAVHGMVTRAAARILQKAEKERSGVISSAQSHTHFLDSPRMTRVLQISSVDLCAIKRECMSIFFILPPDRLESYHRWLRLMIATQLVHLLRTPGYPTHRVVFLLDEFAHLGKMQPIARDIALASGYGATFWLFVQDVSQLKTVYADQWPTFFANAAVVQTFGTNDWATAEYLSKMTGEATIRSVSDNLSRGTSRGKHGSRQESRATTHAERGRRLLLPDEVRRLPVSKQLLLCTATDPILADKEVYYTAPSYQGQFDPNPFHDRR